ncbi:MAG: phage head closure protein [Cellulosilyticaceae bacterium]
MEIGKLNKRITIQRDSQIVNDEGYSVVEWKDITTIWASIKNLHGTEFFQAQQANSRATCKFTIRYIQELDTSMRIVYNGSNYNILYIDNIDEANRYLEILAEVIK